MNNEKLLIALFFVLISCKSEQKGVDSDELQKGIEVEKEWLVLFDGSSLDAWHIYRKEGVSGWVIEANTLMTPGNQGDLITDKKFSDFELELEWKISKGGNSGIKFHVLEDERYDYTFQTGPEYQIIDDEGYKNPLDPTQTSAANFALHPPSKNVVKPVGEFNKARLLVNQERVEHWLNGEKVVEYDLWTEEWRKKVNKTKFKDMPAYGMAKKGHISLQDHGDSVWYRNIRIREL